MKTRSDYDTALAVIKGVIAEWDPYDLLKNEAPDDEFDGEIAKLATRIRDMTSPRAAADAISAIFSAFFEESTFAQEDCAEVGRKLYVRLAEAGLIKP